MDLITIENSLIKFLLDNILAEGFTLSADQDLSEIGIDSYSIVEIVLFIERKFGFVLPDTDLKPENFKDIQAIAIIINRHLSA